MSAPNKSYDPRMVASLAPDEVARMLDEALAAVAAARTLDELKAARIAHDGDRAPLSLASGEIGALPPEARAEAGRRVGAARSRLREALRERQDQLEAERDRQVLSTEAVDVTLPGGRTPPGARHPVTMLSDRLSDVFVAMGYEVAEGPEAEAEWYNFDALNIPPDHPAREMQDTIFIAGQAPVGQPPAGQPPAGQPLAGQPLRWPAEPGWVQVGHGAADAHLAGADQVHAYSPAAALRGQPGPLLPARPARCHAQPGLPPDRGAGRGRGADNG